MFWIVMILIMLQAFFMYKGIENIPFFLYHMFSHGHQPKPAYRVLAIRTGNGYYDHTRMSNREYELVIGSAEKFLALKEFGDGVSVAVNARVGNRQAVRKYFMDQLTNDSLDLAQYPAWWARYFSKVSGVKNQEVSLVSFWVTYDPRLRKVSHDSIVFTVNTIDAD